MAVPLSRAERVALGQSARKQLARGAHSAFTAHTCPTDPLALLFAAERGRLPRLLALKHQRMATSPFVFFRGAVPIFAADLACHPNTGLTTQLCGDAHVSNLGAFAYQSFSKSADSRSSENLASLTFDINDFDETIRGPFEFDLKRLATSMILAGREAGIKRPARHSAVLTLLATYRSSMAAFASMPVAELARYQIHRLSHLDPMPAIFAQAERSTPAKALKSLTEPTQSARRFRSNPPLLQRLPPKEAATVLAALGPYTRTLQPERRHFLAQYLPQDVAFKVVGTGSVGLRDYCIYLEGTHAAASDPLFLQMKEEPASAYAAYLPDGDTHTHQGHRVVDGQRAMQLTSDPFLGYTTIEGRDFLVRQLNDHKASLDLTTLTAASLHGYAELCGELFARGHARAGDPVALAAYLGSSNRFDEAILAFARSYADKTERDLILLRRSLK